MPSPKDVNVKKPVRDALIVAAITVVFLIPVAEIALRIDCAYCTWSERNEGRFAPPYAVGRSSWYRVDAPNTVLNYQMAEFDYEKKTNSLGFRDIEHPISRPAGELRLIAVGDSFTEGWGARFEHTWLNELHAILNAEQGESPIGLMCGGTAGNDPFYNYRMLVDRLLVYRPDFVLLVVNNSDVMDVILRGGMERFQADGTVKGVTPPKTPWLYESSHLARFIHFELFDYTHLLITKSERDSKAEQAMDQLNALLSQYDKLLKSQGIDFTLVLAPHHNELRKNRYDRLDAMKDYALQHQIDVIDTKPYLYQKIEANESTVEDMYWRVDMHFTELGYRYFAEAINIGLAPKINRAREAGQVLVRDSDAL
jgi:hypothetical protein